MFIAAELKPGWAKPVQILGEKYTLYRGESGTPHLTAFRCAHRGLQSTPKKPIGHRYPLDLCQWQGEHDLDPGLPHPG
ncbi:MAG: Rieske 2Fe-2S domain-containing protein [Candidatus Binatia bacterium]